MYIYGNRKLELAHIDLPMFFPLASKSVIKIPAPSESSRGQKPKTYLFNHWLSKCISN